MWHSLVARFVRDEEAAGSNPVIPTRKSQRHVWLARVGGLFFVTRKTASVPAAVYAVLQKGRSRIQHF